MKKLAERLQIVLVFITLCGATLPASVHAQEEQPKYASDWQSPAALVDALYETISADAGETRNWDRFRELFFENAEMLVSIDRKGFQGITAADIETMIQMTEQGYKATGFHEIELDKEIVIYGDLASVYSTFEVKLKASDEKPLMKGLNHFQMLFDGDRWWIISNIGVIDNKKYQASSVLSK